MEVGSTTIAGLSSITTKKASSPAVEEPRLSVGVSPVASPHVAATAAPPVAGAASLPAGYESDEPEEDDDWVPRNKAGNQKSCNVIRGEISRFLAKGEMTQTKFLQEIRCNSNSYGRFMRLKGAYNGTQNGVYWGAARFFARRQRREAWEKKNNPAAAKRKRAEASGTKRKKAKLGDELLAKLASTPFEPGPIYDSCPEIRRKVTAFLKSGTMTQTAFLRHIGVAPNSFKSFMKMKPVPGSAGGACQNRGAALLPSRRRQSFLPQGVPFLRAPAPDRGRCRLSPPPSPAAPPRPTPCCLLRPTPRP
eukprot:SAG25_NODE_3290_length_1143_cov_1.118774_1_plen_306_part_00